MKYSEFINFPIYLWEEREETKEARRRHLFSSAAPAI